MGKSNLEIVNTEVRHFSLSNWLHLPLCLAGLFSYTMPIVAASLPDSSFVKLNSGYDHKDAQIFLAHEVRASQDVGGTIHIEPNDRPVIGRKTRIWIALARRGGELIPYEQCSCQMEVRSLSNRQIRLQISPTLSILNRYLGMPSVEVVFPEVGRYEIKIMGNPRNGANFEPFELVFKTNVGR